ncbi:MAG TPA: Zn-ribbon domain-containing OB-fold protein [Acidimicrobiales bacterium]
MPETVDETVRASGPADVPTSVTVTPAAVPVPDADSRPFWEAAAEGRLVLQRCGACGRLRFPPAPVCSHCGSWDTTWDEVDGHGEVYSWVVVHHAVTPALRGEVPYAVALVELAPGVRIPGRLTGVDHDAIAAGMPVRLVFHPVEGPWPVVGFVPAAGTDGAGDGDGSPA